MFTPQTPPTTPTLLEITKTSQPTSPEEFFKTISNVDTIKDFLGERLNQIETKKKQLQEYFEKTDTLYQVTLALQNQISTIEKGLLLLQQPINSPQTSSEYLPLKSTISSQSLSLSKLQTSTREAIQDLIKENLALKSSTNTQQESIRETIKDLAQEYVTVKNMMRTQQKSISELHTWVSGLVFGGIGCGTTAALMFWLWHYTHK